jgi:branched-chain amino acid transport system substrate-binding protein
VYAAEFAKKYGHIPDYHNAESSATCLAFQYAIEKAGSLDPQKVRDALASLDVVTFYGLLKFDDRGINIYKPMAVNQIQNGELKTVWPTGVQNAQPMYPTPDWSKR